MHEIRRSIIITICESDEFSEFGAKLRRIGGELKE